MDEQRAVPGFRRYRINAQGVVWDTKTGKIMNTHPHPGNGSPYVVLRRGSKQHSRCIGRLVLQAFSPIAGDRYFFTEWIDEDKTNNTLPNLRWKHRTPSNHVLTEDRVRRIRQHWLQDPNVKLKELAEVHGASLSNIKQIVTGRAWVWVK